MKPLNLREILELPIDSKLIVDVKAISDAYSDDSFYCKLLSVTTEKVTLTLEIVRNVESFHDIDLELIQETVIHHPYCGITQQISLDESGVDRIYSSSRPDWKNGSDIISIHKTLVSAPLKLEGEYYDQIFDERPTRYEDEGKGLLPVKFPQKVGAFIAESRSTSPMLRMDDFFASMLMRDSQSRGKFINDNCAYYAHSAHLKCTVNPKGSCEGCKDFWPVDEEPEDTTDALAPMQEPGTGKFVAQRMNELIRNLAESRAQGLEVVDLNDLQ